MSELRQGSLIEGRYAAECQIGQGGAAVVYLCRHVSLGSEHAIKVSKRCSPMAARRVLAEGRAQARLEHPNVVRVTDSCMVDGAPALVMEFVRGPSLASLLQRLRFTQAQVDDLARGVLAGVAAAHAQGIVHRDLKPANILIDVMKGRPVPKIADFGLVKTFELPEPRAQRTRSGSTMGTPEYMSPEQIRNAREVDARADVFSIGAVLYELVTGVRCFHAADLLTVFNRIAQGEYRPVEEMAPHVPQRVIRAIEAALEPDRDRRCQTIAELAAIWFDGAAPPVEDPWDDDGSYRRAVAGWTEGMFTPTPSDMGDDEDDLSVSSIDSVLAATPPPARPTSRPPPVASLPLSFPAGETCAQTIPVPDGDDDVDPVWLATRANPWAGARIWLAAGAIATALGMNAGLVGAALAYGLSGEPPPGPVLTPIPVAAVALEPECASPAAEDAPEATVSANVRASRPVGASVVAPGPEDERGGLKRLFDRNAPRPDGDARGPRRVKNATASE